MTQYILNLIYLPYLHGAERLLAKHLDNVLFLACSRPSANIYISLLKKTSRVCIYGGDFPSK